MENGQIQKLYDRLGEIETVLLQVKVELREILDAEPGTPDVSDAPVCIPTSPKVVPAPGREADGEPSAPLAGMLQGASDDVEHGIESFPAPVDENSYYTADEDDPEPDAVEILEEEDDEAHDPSVEGKHPDLSFITINERVRYRQNLFGNNKEQFDEAMVLLQSLTSYADARRYLIDDLEWNPADDEIQSEFLEKLYLCFKEAR